MLAKYGGVIYRFLKWRWSVIIIVLLSVLLFELIEPEPMFIDGRIDEEFLWDFLFYGVIFSLVLGYIHNQVIRVYLERERLRIVAENMQRLKSQLSEEQDSEEISTIYLQYIRTILPIRAAQMIVVDPGKGNYQRAALWSSGSAALPLPAIQAEAEHCSLQVEKKMPREFSLTTCTCQPAGGMNLWPFRYCVPLFYEGRVVAVLFLYQDEALEINIEQNALLTEMGEEIASALEHSLLRVAAQQGSHSPTNIQNRIARDMHDTLGHNLAYLRLKLAQVSANYQSGDEGSLINDLILLRDTAGEAYQQMRDLLVALTPENTPNLRSTLTHYAQRVAERAGFEVEINIKGQVAPLAPASLRQIIFIVREALANVEKHAYAKHVSIEVRWLAERIEIQIVDDGRGFEEDKLNNRKLGIKFMQDRAREVNGELELHSVPGERTTLLLRVPFEIT